ncbi:hypothetical protein BDU57DRAFT_533020 [Ampelomyces quisqualis]|uniref:Uncharacterized protein n=1 Tax=Ampelomyces quisqualis TaxID=50730 RepID=A0A6A5Q9L3_AMPQU|nr:hypothetical protein BDU57DRAFT_533020 [Ampelomyces quisqualis]
MLGNLKIMLASCLTCFSLLRRKAPPAEDQPTLASDSSPSPPPIPPPAGPSTPPPSSPIWAPRVVSHRRPNDFDDDDDEDLPPPSLPAAQRPLGSASSQLILLLTYRACSIQSSSLAPHYRNQIFCQACASGEQYVQCGKQSLDPISTLMLAENFSIIEMPTRAAIPARFDESSKSIYFSDMIGRDAKPDSSPPRGASWELLNQRDAKKSSKPIQGCFDERLGSESVFLRPHRASWVMQNGAVSGRYLMTTTPSSLPPPPLAWKQLSLVTSEYYTRMFRSSILIFDQNHDLPTSSRQIMMTVDARISETWYEDPPLYLPASMHSADGGRCAKQEEGQSIPTPTSTWCPSGNANRGGGR